MDRIPLRIQVLPWKDDDANAAGIPSRQKPILPWFEPCPRNLLISELTEKIVTQFETIHAGKGKLKIKWLENIYGFLNPSYCVGECFINWPGVSFDIEHFTVKVMREPPTLKEIQNPARDVSIAPGFSARIQKRVYNDLPEPKDEISNDYAFGATANKRRRLEETRMNDPDHPILSSERDLSFLQDQQSSQLINGPSYLIPDSQHSPRNEQQNSYGTPQSLSVSSPHGLVPSSQKDPVVILDSPPLRSRSSVLRTPRLSKEPKSESPDPQATNGFLKPQISIADVPPPHPKPSVSSTQPSDSPAAQFKTPGSRLQKSISTAISEGPLPRPLRSINSSFLGRDREELVRPQTSPRDIFEPQMSDVESSQELPPLPNLKRSKLHSSPTFKPRLFSQLNSTFRTDSSQTLTTPDIVEIPFDWPKSGAQRGGGIKHGSDNLRIRHQKACALDMQPQHTLPSNHGNALGLEDLTQQTPEAELGKAKSLTRKDQEVERIKENGTCVSVGNSMKVTSKSDIPTRIDNAILDHVNPSPHLQVTVEDERNQIINGMQEKTLSNQGKNVEVESHGDAAKNLEELNTKSAKGQQGEQGKGKSGAEIKGKKSQEHLVEGDQDKAPENRISATGKNARKMDLERKTKIQLAADRRTPKKSENISKIQLVADKEASKELEKKLKDEGALEKAKSIRANLEKGKNLIFEAGLAEKELKMAREQRSKTRLSSNTSAGLDCQSVECLPLSNNHSRASASLESQPHLQSALRVLPSTSGRTLSSSPSISRRSVTFAEALVEHPADTNLNMLAKPDVKHNLRQPLLPTSSEKEGSRSCTIQPRKSPTPDKVVNRRRSSSQKADSGGKVQSKLNVTRRVEKGKGRILDQPSPIKPAPSKPVIELSDVPSSAIKSRSLAFDGNVGRSKRRSPSTSSLVGTSKTENTIPPIVPSVQQEMLGTANLGITELERASADFRSDSKSTSRSPAREIVSSDSSSYESESESQDADEDEERFPSTPNQTVPPKVSRGPNSLPTKGSSGTRGKEDTPKRSFSSSTSRSEDESENESQDDSEDEEVPALKKKGSSGAEDEAGQQLQREARQSIEPSHSQKLAASKAEPESPVHPSQSIASKTHQTRASTLRPANRVFPSMSALKAKTVSMGSNQHSSSQVSDFTIPPSRNLKGNSKATEIIVCDLTSTESSSESDSIDEDDGNASNPAAHSKKANKLQGLLKMARKLGPQTK